MRGEYTAAYTQIGATANKSVLTGTHLLLGRDKQWVSSIWQIGSFIIFGNYPF